MDMNLWRPSRRTILTGAFASAVALGLSACSGGGSGTTSSGASGGSASDLDAALKKGGTITYWTWTPSAKAQVAAFEKAYPNVTVKLVNTGGAGDSNTKLQNVISAGSGGPDVVQIEYQSLGQFVLPGSVLDLKDYGLDSLKSKFATGPWSSITVGDTGVWGLPQDSGPMAMFYNKEVFDAHDLTVPTTWDEYVAVGKKLKAASPSTFLVNDQGTDAGFATSMIWQAGGKPFSSKGEDVTIDASDPGIAKWTNVWNQLVDGGMVGSISGWTDDWFTALGDGTIATLPIGAWMPGVLEANVAKGKGKWRVAAMPSYDGTAVNSENGGSAEVVMKASTNPALAAAFLRWLNSDAESIKVFLASGGFPGTTAELESADFTGLESEYFGGQKINQVLVAGSSSVLTGWQYLPWQAYANSIYADNVSKAYTGKTDIKAAVDAWLAASAKYGTQQGYTVKS